MSIVERKVLRSLAVIFNPETGVSTVDCAWGVQLVREATSKTPEKLLSETTERGAYPLNNNGELSPEDEEVLGSKVSALLGRAGADAQANLKAKVDEIDSLNLAVQSLQSTVIDRDEALTVTTTALDAHKQALAEKDQLIQQVVVQAKAEIESAKTELESVKSNADTLATALKREQESHDTTKALLNECVNKLEDPKQTPKDADPVVDVSADSEEEVLQAVETEAKVKIKTPKV